MKGGVPPTDPNARTGELTPPGVTAVARRKSCSETGRAADAASGAAAGTVASSVDGRGPRGPLPSPLGRDVDALTEPSVPVRASPSTTGCSAVLVITGTLHHRDTESPGH